MANGVGHCPEPFSCPVVHLQGRNPQLNSKALKRVRGCLCVGGGPPKPLLHLRGNMATAQSRCPRRQTRSLGQKFRMQHGTHLASSVAGPAEAAPTWRQRTQQPGMGWNKVGVAKHGWRGIVSIHTCLCTPFHVLACLHSWVRTYMCVPCLSCSAHIDD